jgi:anhydro-N-acetylmuramic acid kinase
MDPVPGAAAEEELFVGLMSGTSLDGVDGVLVDFTNAPQAAASQAPLGKLVLRAHAHRPFPPALRDELLALNAPGGNDELHRSNVAAHGLAHLYREVVAELLAKAGLSAERVKAIGAHGQTVRHVPQALFPRGDAGYTIQINHPALLVELTGIGVVADFRSRDMAAGGQGAPLVPAFHRALFGRTGESSAVLNLGGISNLTAIHADGSVRGFDCGPANVLMDHWCTLHTGCPFDADGAWAARGSVLPRLLDLLLDEPYFALPAPKSTGRDLFNPAWLDQRLAQLGDIHPPPRPEDVQATLCELSALTCASAVSSHAPSSRELLVCGGGALNRHLMQRLAHHLPGVAVSPTDTRGLPAMQVEAAAFAWLAYAHLHRQPGNLSTVTGAAGPRILGAFYPA